MPKPTSNQILNRSGVVGNTVTDALETLRTNQSFGDMTKAVYDTNNNGKVDVAEVAENVQWVNIYDKPFTFPPSAHSHTDATTADSGFMSASDKTKLNGIAPGATANDTDVNLKNRANHTGTQAISTVTGLQTALNGKQNTLVSGTTIKTINGDSLLGSGNLVISGGGGGGSSAWGAISGTLSDQTDLQTALNAKANTADLPAVPTKTSDLTNDSGFVTASTPVIASEPLTAGDWVSLWDSGGDARVRKSDHASLDKEVDGYVLVGVASGAVAEVFTSGMNTAVDGQQLGSVFTAAAGAGSASVGAGAAFAQRIGTAVRPDAVVFSRGPAVGL